MGVACKIIDKVEIRVGEFWAWEGLAVVLLPVRVVVYPVAAAEFSKFMSFVKSLMLKPSAAYITNQFRKLLH